MSRFAPIRHSSPAKPITAPRATTASSTAVASISDTDVRLTGVPSELANLSQEIIDFIDAVIERAGSSSTRFLNVFKAYNDLLQERGLDSQNEVVLYGALLKIGTLKAATWGEKWKMVKLQNGMVDGAAAAKKLNERPPLKARQQHLLPPPRISAPISTKLTLGLKETYHDSDTDNFTLHSHQNDTDTQMGRGETEVVPLQQRPFRRVSRLPLRPAPPSSPAASTVTAANSLGLDFGTPTPEPEPEPSPSPEPLPRFSRALPRPRQPLSWNTATALPPTTEVGPSSSGTPQSYGAAAHQPPTSISAFTRLRRQTSETAHTQPSAIARLAIAQAKERKASVINEEDAWKRIKESRDEEEADRWRREKLLERCWDVWRQGYEWIITTDEQVAQARDNLILRKAFQRWQALTAARRELYHRVTTLSNNRRLRAALNIWKAKFAVKKREAWRREMRNKMKSIREERERKLLVDAWVRWRKARQLNVAERLVEEKIERRCLRKWQDKLIAVERMEVSAEEFQDKMDEMTMIRCWGKWKKMVDLRNAERVMVERVGLRVMGNAMNVWRKRMHDYHKADAFYDVVVQRNFFRAWQTAQGRIRALERKADRHLAKQDDILVRAIMRVWRAHERGKLLERVKTTRVLKGAWAVWKSRIQAQREREELAVSFASRPNSAVTVSALRTWYQVYTTHRDVEDFAARYHSAQLSYRMLTAWRLQLRARLKLARRAKQLEKWFLVRRTWAAWKAKHEEKQREQKIQVLQRNKLDRYFSTWAHRARQQRHHRLAEQCIQTVVNRRIMAETLAKWTNRVIDIKVREIDVAQAYEYRLVCTAFKKWKDGCIRHAEEVSLMQSYQDVKREEMMRRMFYRWLSAARASRHKRLTLQRKEEEMRLASLEAAWDKWRERFQDRRLRPIEDAVLIQSQRNRVFRAFGVWHSRTRSLPAIRFHASHVKANFWQKWREAMPRALQTRQAREMDKKLVLGKAMQRWIQKYKNKVALKAIARARYLRLPTAAPRPISQASSSHTRQPSFTRRLSGPRVPSPETAEETTESEAVEDSTQISFRSRPWIAERTGGTSFFTAALSATSEDTLSRRPMLGSRPRRFTRGGRDPSPTGTQTSRGTRRRSPSPTPTRLSLPLPPPTSDGGRRRSSLMLELQEVKRKSTVPSASRPWGRS